MIHAPDGAACRPNPPTTSRKSTAEGVRRATRCPPSTRPRTSFASTAASAALSSQSSRRHECPLQRTIVELDDRWRLPLHGSRVAVIDWHDRDFVLSFDCGMELAAAYSTQLSPVFRGTGDYGRRPIAHWSRSEAEQRLQSSDVVSSVAFRVGQLRIVFRSGLTLRALCTDPVCPARIRVGGQVLWDGSGVKAVDGLEIERVVLPPPPPPPPATDDAGRPRLVEDAARQPIRAVCDSWPAFSGWAIGRAALTYSLGEWAIFAEHRQELRRSAGNGLDRNRSDLDAAGLYSRVL